MTAPMTLEELLPCPFCAGPAEYFLNPSRGDNSMARCRCCGAEAFGRKWNIRDPGVAQTSGWQPIATLPRDGRYVMVFRPLAMETGDETLTITKTLKGKTPTVSPQGVKHWTERWCHPTLWMDIPPPPSNQGASK